MGASDNWELGASKTSDNWVQAILSKQATIGSKRRLGARLIASDNWEQASDN